eukprot:TRINITY_DN23032_c0_g1_i1.p1 TRINITY_DN23032_c0_g1~~TRINITY_DN23032_c0_g1_i1.p1  ORF type:complete len:249 (+),score=47.44 TRINITY_DN23032_c0_g1_i1:81-827(+)
MEPLQKATGSHGNSSQDDDEDVLLDESFFINESYEMKTFTYGPHVLQLFCLPSASTDYDLTGQLVWPGAELLNHHLTKHSTFLSGKSVIELGSGVGVTGLLCSRFCKEVVMTDCSEVVLKVLQRNINMLITSENTRTGIRAEKLEWGNEDQLMKILKLFPTGFDFVIGADICFQQSSIPLLFDTVTRLLQYNDKHCKFVLAYVSRAKSIDMTLVNEAKNHGLQIYEVLGSRSMVAKGSYEGVIYEFTL